MRQVKYTWCYFVLFNTLLPNIFSQTLEPLPNNNPDQKGKKHLLIAGTETLFINGLFTGITGYVLNYPWAHPTAEGIRENFLNGAIWEKTDGFKVNQIGHPWQGSLYFNAGRANEFSFYESMTFSAFGSVAWEMICESTAPSLNDMITTTFAAAPVGEMLHRLYLEANTAGIPWPFSFLISPTDGLNKFMTGKSPQSKGGNLYALGFFAGGAYAHMNATEKTRDKNLFSFSGPAAAIGINVIYGDPFEQQSVIPYEQFELDMTFDVDTGNYIDLRIISDGYLFSFSPFNIVSDMMSMGLTMHFDFVSSGKFDLYDSTIDYANNALDWTIKYRHIFRNGLVLESKTHAGVTFFGVSEFFSPDTTDTILKNYGGGTNIKLFFDVTEHIFGKVSFSVFQYSLWTFPETTDLSAGNVHWLFVDVKYSRFISKHLSLGAAFSSVLEYGYFTGFPDTRKWSTAVKTFITWNL
jgi:hypothetical protein